MGLYVQKKRFSSQAAFITTLIVFLFLYYNFSKTIFENRLATDITQDELQFFNQDDHLLWTYIRTFHLFPPSTKPYRLNKPERVGDPSDANSFKSIKTVMKILKNKTNGVFLEVGAYDGETYTNTLMLERDYGWRGLLIEGDPMIFPNLKKKHRKAWISDACLSPTQNPKLVDFQHADGYDIASRIDKPTNVTKNWTAFEVQCFPLFSILAAADIDTIDYFSLDVEGIEMKVLLNLPFDKIFTKIFSIEWHVIPEGPDALKTFMKTKGYHHVDSVGVDFMFAHESVLEKH